MGSSTLKSRYSAAATRDLFQITVIPIGPNYLFSSFMAAITGEMEDIRGG